MWQRWLKMEEEDRKTERKKMKKISHEIESSSWRKIWWNSRLFGVAKVFLCNGLKKGFSQRMTDEGFSQRMRCWQVASDNFFKFKVTFLVTLNIICVPKSKIYLRSRSVSHDNRSTFQLIDRISISLFDRLAIDRLIYWMLVFLGCVNRWKVSVSQTFKQPPRVWEKLRKILLHWRIFDISIFLRQWKVLLRCVSEPLPAFWLSLHCRWCLTSESSTRCRSHELRFHLEQLIESISDRKYRNELFRRGSESSAENSLEKTTTTTTTKTTKRSMRRGDRFSLSRKSSLASTSSSDAKRGCTRSLRCLTWSLSTTSTSNHMTLGCARGLDQNVLP